MIYGIKAVEGWLVGLIKQIPGVSNIRPLGLRVMFDFDYQGQSAKNVSLDYRYQELTPDGEEKINHLLLYAEQGEEMPERFSLFFIRLFAQKRYRRYEPSVRNSLTWGFLNIGPTDLFELSEPGPWINMVLATNLG